jgi:predicted dehydrogenase
VSPISPAGLQASQRICVTLARTFRNTTPFPLIENFTETPAGRDPLGLSVAGFLAAVRGEAPRPVVTGEEAARALDLALAVEQAAEG